jgi:hypothetical protein
MNNVYASFIVLALLTACGAYTYQNTHPRQVMHPRQTLMPAYPAAAWDEYVQHGGAFRGR